MITIQKKSSSNKIATISIIALAFLTLFSIAYIYAFDGNILGWSKNNISSVSPNNSDKPSREQIDAGNQAKQNSIKNTNENDTAGKNSSGSDQPPAPTPQQNGKSNVGIAITSVNQTNELMQIRTLIYSVQNQGSCTLVMTKGNSVITKSSDIQPLSSTSTCKGFDILVSELSSGSWQAKFSYNSDTLEGSTTKTIDVK